MLGLASGLDVKVGVVARDALCLHGIVGVIGSEILELIENLLADKVALLHPSDLPGRSADLDEATIVVEDLDAVSILDEASLFVDGGDAIAEIDLNSRDVRHFEDATARVATGRQNGEQEHKTRDAQRCGERLHGGQLFNITLLRASDVDGSG
jgi:hypothetical protein